MVKKFNLTERELQVLEGINNGLSNQEIAAQLFLSLSTVKFHIGNLYSKLDIKNRTQAIKLLHRK
ncbi:LuxR C-terminal-related transcriptional regulator [Myroides ceti]|uniref:LuxR C-terminal-related transcriptional regulator n=1 Tax=Paenimyroides ceti TaxID=395087 RepID=A0ABT8D1J0_9FLAO|nr:LuxR C-terminal-related transcriptional regulator [Paenimyroides ceti]MDN3710477.1 LuxR C-terminal-related transcriptional regulator [Paenimyroides ceti]